MNKDDYIESAKEKLEEMKKKIAEAEKVLDEDKTDYTRTGKVIAFMENINELKEDVLENMFGINELIEMAEEADLKEGQINE